MQPNNANCDTFGSWEEKDESPTATLCHGGTWNGDTYEPCVARYRCKWQTMEQEGTLGDLTPHELKTFETLVADEEWAAARVGRKTHAQLFNLRRKEREWNEMEDEIWRRREEQGLGHDELEEGTDLIKELLRRNEAKEEGKRTQEEEEAAEREAFESGVDTPEWRRRMDEIKAEQLRIDSENEERELEREREEKREREMAAAAEHLRKIRNRSRHVPPGRTRPHVPRPNVSRPRPSSPPPPSSYRRERPSPPPPSYRRSESRSSYTTSSPSWFADSGSTPKQHLVRLLANAIQGAVVAVCHQVVSYLAEIDLFGRILGAV